VKISIHDGDEEIAGGEGNAVKTGDGGGGVNVGAGVGEGDIGEGETAGTLALILTSPASITGAALDVLQ